MAVLNPKENRMVEMVNAIVAAGAEVVANATKRPQQVKQAQSAGL